jgi:hypothetical protein
MERRLNEPRARLVTPPEIPTQRTKPFEVSYITREGIRETDRYDVLGHAVRQYGKLKSLNARSLRLSENRNGKVTVLGEFDGVNRI